MENIIFTTDANMTLTDLLKEVGHEQLFFVADRYTVSFCDELFEHVDWDPSHLVILERGEENKSLTSVMSIWAMLSERGARRSSVLVCVGGGMVTDLGGFAASTFKRGMRCICVPTTLLAQVDASLGGKTGFNFNGLKNEIGTFSIPENVVIDASFLGTLPWRERISGFAEMLKHGLLSDREHLERLLSCDLEEPQSVAFLALIRESVIVKDQIVRLDPREKGIRKALNFGHTVGHAIESLAILQKKSVLHGEAVALGLVAELYLSVLEKDFPVDVYDRLREFVKRYYLDFPVMKHVDVLYELMLHDKKNDGKGVNFTLLRDVGDISIDNYCSKEKVIEALSRI